MKSILIFSPHPDDAVLSCADHILNWQKKGYQVTVCTVFTAYPSGIQSQAAIDLIKQAHLSDSKKYEEVRILEDIKAIKAIGAKYINLKYPDAAFRLVNKKILYPTFTSLFSTKISNGDMPLVAKLNKYFIECNNTFDIIIAPLGIGDHVDHTITNYCAKNSIVHDKLYYYFEVPYYFRFKHWSTNLVTDFFSWKKSILFTSQNKRKAMYFYTSQQEFLFNKNKRIFFNSKFQLFPEIIIGKGNSL